MSKSLISRRPLFGCGSSTVPSSGECRLSALQRLGWKPFFLQQLSLDKLNDREPVRVMAVHRSQLQVAGESGEQSLPLTPAQLAQAGAGADHATAAAWRNSASATVP